MALSTPKSDNIPLIIKCQFNQANLLRLSLAAPPTPPVIRVALLHTEDAR